MRVPVRENVPYVLFENQSAGKEVVPQGVRDQGIVIRILSAVLRRPARTGIQVHALWQGAVRLGQERPVDIWLEQCVRQATDTGE